MIVKNSIIGGGSLVTKNIPENVLVYGNPAKIIKKFNSADEALQYLSKK